MSEPPPARGSAAESVRAGEPEPESRSRGAGELELESRSRSRSRKPLPAVEVQPQPRRSISHTTAEQHEPAAEPVPGQQALT